jgi:hydroxymethylglutaryl-CoA synthase
MEDADMAGLIAYGAYVPYHRLARTDVAAALGGRGGKGTRAVAGYDEDTTSMAVEAARDALARDGLRARVSQLFLATAAPAYLDKTNATAVHAALGLDQHVLAADMAGSVRSGLGALVTAARSPVPTLTVLSDLRTGLPGGSDEVAGGDGAAAFVFGGHRNGAPVIAELLAHDTVSDEILDRWRLPGAPVSRVWEERFAEEIYVSLADKALTAALDHAAVDIGAIDHFVVAGLHARACAAVRRTAGVRPEAVTPDLAGAIGNAGTAQSPRRSPRAAPRCRTPRTCPGAVSSTANRPVGRTPSRPTPHPHTDAPDGSTASSPPVARSAPPGICRRTGCAPPAGASTP